MKLNQLFCDHELGIHGGILFEYSPDRKVVMNDCSHFICKKCGKSYKEITMIDIDKLLDSKHVTIRFFGTLGFYNSCIHSNQCVDNSCKNCSYTNYYVRFKNGNKHRLPGFIQVILRKIWS